MIAVTERCAVGTGSVAVSAALLLSGTVNGRPVRVGVNTVPEILIEIERWIAQDQQATGTWCLSSDYSNPVTLIARRQAGLCAESRRVAHLFRLEPGVAQGFTLTARCGEVVTLVEVEWLSPGTGMPCEACLSAAARDLH